MLMMPPVGSYAESGELNLDKLIAEGLKNSPEILASQARAEAAATAYLRQNHYRIPFLCSVIRMKGFGD
jgi:hypothetical protein